MSVDLRQHSPDLWIIRPQGRLDHQLTPLLEETLAQIRRQEGRFVVVDMGAVTYINSGGLRALVSGWRQARAAGGDLLLAAMLPHVRDVFEMVGFQQVFSCFETVEAACRAAGSDI